MTHLALGAGAEFDRIRAIARALGPRARDLGDDCALLPEGRGTVVLSTDLSIENVHFRRAWLEPDEIGWRAAAASVSDLAAEGATPVGVLTSVGVPAEAAEEDLVALMRGVGALADHVGAAVLGGDLTAAPAWTVDVVAVGRAERPVRRAGARPGDGIWVTGSLGAARAAVEAWRAGIEPSRAAREAFARPEPRIGAGLWLASYGARAMLDLSDGLGGDAGHLAAASGVALELSLDHLPVSQAARQEASRMGVPPGLFAAEGGEDYELLAAMPGEFGPSEAARFEEECGLPLTRIGEAYRGEGVRALLAGAVQPLAGFDHFR